MHSLNAAMQSNPIEPDDLALVLALTRAPTLADAATRLGVDTSTVFRSLQRIERRLGQRLFERDRGGYRASDLALQLAGHAERIEGELEAARSHLAEGVDRVSGLVRLTTTDTLLYGLVMPMLGDLLAQHPNLRFDLDASNELASLTRRDADLALRDEAPARASGRSTSGYGSRRRLCASRSGARCVAPRRPGGAALGRAGLFLARSPVGTLAAPASA